MVLFSAPHMQCCFYAYASLKEGAERWLERYKTAARTYPDFFKILQAGDAAGVAKALGRAGYYTASEAAYANAMISQRRILDAQLGPIPSPPLRLGREASSADRRARQ